MLTLRRGNNIGHRQFALTSTVFDVETFRANAYDISAFFNTSDRLVISIFAGNNNNNKSCTFTTVSKINVTNSSTIGAIRFSIENLKFYQNGNNAVFSDIIPFGVDLSVNIDKCNPAIQGGGDGVIDWGDIANKPSTILSAVTHDVNTLVGDGTPASALRVAPRVFPYYYPRWTFGGTYEHSEGPPSAVTNGVFWQDPAYVVDGLNWKELLIPYIDVSGVDHEAEMKKLDYSSVIHIYNSDKTKKNKYVFAQSAIGNPGFIIILCDTSGKNLNEEFTFTIGETYSMEFIFSAIQDINDLRNMSINNPQDDEVLTYSGGAWINTAISGSSGNTKEYGFRKTTAVQSGGNSGGSLIEANSTTLFSSSGLGTIGAHPNALGFQNTTDRTLTLVCHFACVITKDGVSGLVFFDDWYPSQPSHSLIGLTCGSGTYASCATTFSAVLPPGDYFIIKWFVITGTASIVDGARLWVHEA